jgi:AcrR family transcriptional regulator
MGAKVAATGVKDASQDKPRVRDRIFDTACDLFYKHGIRAVGVDAIANEAGTNKMSFYRSFPSKDELVAEYLRDQESEYWAWWDDSIAAFEGDPRRQIEALFDAFLEMNCSKKKVADVGCKSSRGCPLGNAAVEIADDNETLGDIVHDYKSKIRQRLRQLARAAGAKDADALGDSLMLLMEGGYYTRLTFPHNTGPVAAVARAARVLIDVHLA